MEDEDYEQIMALSFTARDNGNGPGLSGEDTLRYNAALVWAHYKAAVRYGQTFRNGEKQIKGLLADGFTIKELQDCADAWKGSQRAPGWMVFESLDPKAEDRRARQENDRKTSTAHEQQKERLRQEQAMKEENVEILAKWRETHPNRKFPGMFHPEVAKWLNPDLTDEQINDLRNLRSKVRSS